MIITTHLDELIAEEKAKAAAKIAKLKRAAEAEQRKVDAKVVEILREGDVELYEHLAAQARDALDAERAKRSRRAKKAAPSSSPEVDGSGQQIDDPSSAEVASWNG